jgi:NADH-quinone oxidoreductase subunit J
MENVLFAGAAAVALMAAVLVITRRNAVHALLYMVLNLLAIALAFVLLGASFAAALQVIVYAGAIMVLFIFVIMMLNLGEAAVAQERRWLSDGVWRVPALLCGLLALEFGLTVPWLPAVARATDVHAVAQALFGPWMLAVEAASLLLLAGLVAAWHLGRGEAGEA